jgi:hypothetical protein
MRDKNRKPVVVYMVGKRTETGILTGKIQDYKGTFNTKKEALDACTDPSLKYYTVENTPEAIYTYIPNLSKKVKGKGGTTNLKATHEVDGEDS